MGSDVSIMVEKKPSRTKSNLAEKNVNLEEIAEFASQLNHLATLRLDDELNRYDYNIFNKIPFKGKFVPLPFCQKISTSSDSVFLCYDCSSDPFAYLCEECFQKGKHEGHRFNVFVNNSGWNQLYCRCGDYEFMNKGTICDKHKQVKTMANVLANQDQKDKRQFSLYFNEIFKTLFSLVEKQGRNHKLINALLTYLQKSTQNNLQFSKILCEFLLEKNIDDESNLLRLIKACNLSDKCFFRNINFATEYKLPILREMISALNKQTSNINNLHETIINFAGRMEHLDFLAEKQNLILGIQNPNGIEDRKFSVFYDKIIAKDFSVNEIWKCIIRNRLVCKFIKQQNVLRKIILFLYEQNNNQLTLSVLQQLVQGPISFSKNYILPCLMVLAQDCFLSSKNVAGKSFDKKIEALLVKFYKKVFAALNTHKASEQTYEKYLLLLPFFSFGDQAINNLWEEVERRVNILEKSKEKAIIKGANDNYFAFLTNVLRTFFTWEHAINQQAHTNKLNSFISDKKLIDKLLREYFFKEKKIKRPTLLKKIDIYTQNQRNLATQPIKKYLRFNQRKGKYYYVGQKLENNLFNYQELNVGAAVRLAEWQEFVGKRFFTEKVYKIVPSLIRIAQRGVMEDTNMVKTVANIAIGLSLLNKPQKTNLKNVTRTFIKQIPDVNEDVYYMLAGIRDRFQLDIDDLEEEGMKGKKRVKLDLITEIRDKKYKQMKQRQQNILRQWLKDGDVEQNNQEYVSEGLCHICKQKPHQSNRLIYLCNFTRNNVISTLLKSQVTDLDMNICLHRIHEKCYEKIPYHKKECPVCKFDFNCYIPEKPLNDESYTKTWLRNFENIVTTINLESGKSFNSDWATIFLTYLVFNRSFKVLLKNTQLQAKQLKTIDSLLMLHYKNQLQKWPQLTKQAIKRAQKTVKGQVRRQSNIKKAVKSLSLDLVLQQITQQPFKNEKRVQKKVRQLVNFIGQANSQKVVEGFEYCKKKQQICEIIQQSISEQVEEDKQLFKIRQFPSTIKKYLETTSIKCPMCGKYRSTTWQCLFCEKVCCDSCISMRNHCQRDHRGSSIILYLNNAEYKLVHENREVQKDSLYRNEFSEGWTRNLKPEGWKCCMDEIYQFFDTILHSFSINKNKQVDDNSDDGRGHNNNFGFNIPVRQTMNWPSQAQSEQQYQEQDDYEEQQE